MFGFARADGLCSTSRLRITPVHSTCRQVIATPVSLLEPSLVASSQSYLSVLASCTVMRGPSDKEQIGGLRLLAISHVVSSCLRRYSTVGIVRHLLAETSTERARW